MTIQAVFFDMGGTIETFSFTQELRLNATPGIASRLGAAGIQFGMSNQELMDVVTSGLKRYHEWSLETCVELPPATVWRDFILTGQPIDYAALDKIAEELMVYIEVNYYDRKIRPEVPQVLAAIRSMGLKIGLISNVNSQGQVPYCLDRYGLRQYFDPIVLSSEYGFRKPDPSIFHYAARLMGVPTSTCLYVGDRISRDILGAKKAGFRLAVQIEHNFDHGEEDSGPEPNAVITDLTCLVDILKGELNGPFELPKPGVRAFIFDAGDVLYRRPRLKAALAEFLISVGADPDIDCGQEIEALNERAFAGDMDFDDFQAELLRLRGVNNPGDIARGTQLMRIEHNQIEFFEGTAETLTSLKNQGYLLGIITDTATTLKTKLDWLERGGFGHVWDSIISSRELGACKPDPRMYHACLNQLGVPAEQAVFVGHAADELTGARAVGMQTVAFNRDMDATANHMIDHFSELLQLPL